MEQMARDAITFIAAMGFSQADILGFSIGSFVAEQIALLRPSVVRRLVLASSVPQGAAGMHGWAAEVIGTGGARKTSPENYLDVFFTSRLPAARRAKGCCAACTPGRQTGMLPPHGPPARRRTTRCAPGDP